MKTIILAADFSTLPIMRLALRSTASARLPMRFALRGTVCAPRRHFGSRQTTGDHADNLDRHAATSADGASPSLLDRVLDLIPGGSRASPTSAISMSDLRSNFDAVDALVSKGGVTLEESCAALESLGGSASDAEFLHRTLDLRGNGLIEFGELVSAIVLLSSEEGTEAYEGKGSGSKIGALPQLRC